MSSSKLIEGAISCLVFLAFVAVVLSYEPGRWGWQHGFWLETIDHEPLTVGECTGWNYICTFCDGIVYDPDWQDLDFLQRNRYVYNGEYLQFEPVWPWGIWYDYELDPGGWEEAFWYDDDGVLYHDFCQYSEPVTDPESLDVDWSKDRVYFEAMEPVAGTWFHEYSWWHGGISGWHLIGHAQELCFIYE